jgi:type I restriction enzyme R subunit
MSETSEKSFEATIVSTPAENFDREHYIFPDLVLAFIRPDKQWEKLEALHGEKTSERIIHDLCKWMDSYGSFSTLCHWFKCYGRTLRVAFF